MRLAWRDGSEFDLAPSKIVGLLGNDRGRRDGRRGDAGSGGTEPGGAERDDVDLFLKAPSSLVGPDGVVRMPPGDVRLVPECELAVIIGRGGADIAAADAADHVIGWTIALDLTVRGPHDRSRRKSHDTFCPVGPWIVPADEFGDPDDRAVRLRVDGELVQDWSTDQMVLPVFDAIAWVSSIMRLEPGDLILTGAPRMTRQLTPGETLQAEIDGIGTFHIEVKA